MDLVVAMGLVPRARDIQQYVPIAGRNPDWENDDPAWVIQTHGQVQCLLVPGLSIDPTCVVVRGTGDWVPTGGRIEQDGTMATPRPPDQPPIYRLPPLAP